MHVDPFELAMHPTLTSYDDCCTITIAREFSHIPFMNESSYNRRVTIRLKSLSAHPTNPMAHTAPVLPLILSSFALLILTAQASQPCCYSDACDRSTICADPSTDQSESRLTDSCGVTYIVAPNCVLKRTRCCYTDGCNKKNRICALHGETITDACKRTYRVASDGTCQLNDLRRCCYTDACNDQKICALQSHILTDSCGASYNITDSACQLDRLPLPPTSPPSPTCCYTDACNNQKICAKRGGGVFTDSCKSTYMALSDCKLSFMPSNSNEDGDKSHNDECCYVDACKQSRICAPRGGVLPDSCGRAYVVSTTTCALKALQCCAKDKCASKDPNGGDDDSHQTCAQIVFSKDFPASLLASKDVYCTGFRSVIDECGDRDDVSIVMEGVRQIVQIEVGTNASVSVHIGHGSTSNYTGHTLASKSSRFPIQRSRLCYFGDLCAAKVVLTTKQKMRYYAIKKIFDKLLRRPDWSELFGPRRDTVILKRKKAHGTFYYVAVLNFHNRFAKEHFG